jgi:hypothetical protein
VASGGWPVWVGVTLASVLAASFAPCRWFVVHGDGLKASAVGTNAAPLT